VRQSKAGRARRKKVKEGWGDGKGQVRETWRGRGEARRGKESTFPAVERDLDAGALQVALEGGVLREGRQQLVHLEEGSGG
jgi:hypothetical protein